MIINKIILIATLALPLTAADTDDEIIKNLDFFQSMEVLKEENPYVDLSPIESIRVEQKDLQKNELSVENKQ